MILPLSLNDLIGYLAMALLVCYPLFQAFQMWKTKQTQDISFIGVSVCWIGTLLLCIYGYIIGSWPLVIFNGFSLLIVTYMWCAKFDAQPVIKYRVLSEFFDQKTTQTPNKRGD